MSQPANTYDAYSAIGQRESLDDIISNISPTDNPFRTGIKKGKATAALEEWQTDALAAASVNNAVIEGDDATLDASSPTVRLGNYCQISDKTAVVSGTVDVVKKAGRGKELAYQKIKKGLELRNDQEAILLNNQAKSSGSSDSTPRKLAGVPSWIATNINEANDATTATGDGSDARVNGTARAFTESMLTDVLQQCWDNGGNPKTLMVGGYNKRVVSGFDGGATKNVDTKDKRLVATVDIYEGDFSTLSVVANRFQDPSHAFVLDFEYWEMRNLRPIHEKPLARTGDSEKVQIITEYTLISRNEKASGAIYDLTTSA